MPAEPSPSLPAPGARPIRVGASARLLSGGASLVAGRVSYVGSEIVGVKASSAVDGRVAEGDSVTLVIGLGESQVAAQARVLAASGSFVRLSCRETSTEIARRRDRSVPLEVAARITYSEPEGASPRTVSVRITELSTTRGAIAAETLPTVGEPVTVEIVIDGTVVKLAGTVVRSWRSGAGPGEYAGVRFDPLPTATMGLLDRFLVGELRRTSDPRRGARPRPALRP